MADPAEQNKAGGNEIQEAKQIAQNEIKDARANKIGNQLTQAENDLAQKYLQELVNTSTAAKEVRVADHLLRERGVESKKEEAKIVKKTLVKVLEGIKSGVLTPKTQSSQVILSELAEQSEKLTDTTASYLHEFAEKYYYRDILFSKAGQEPTEFEKDFRTLNEENPIAGGLLGEILLKKLSQISNVSEADLKKQLQIEADVDGKVKSPKMEVKKEKRKTREEEDSDEEKILTPEEMDKKIDTFIERLRQESFDLYLTSDDTEFLKIIYFPDKFINYVGEKVNDEIKELQEHHKSINENVIKHVQHKVSEEIEEKLIDVLDKILTRFSETAPEKFFQDVASENFMRGITTTLSTLGSFIDRLRQGLEEYEQKHPELLKGMKMYKGVGLDPITEDIEIEYKDENGKTTYVEKPRTRYRPLSKPEGTSLSGFASYMRLMMDEYVQLREYLHNSRAILTHPKHGDQGFYAQLGEYAEKFKTPAVEEMFLFPNAGLFQDAINLYEKYVEEQFAAQDWKHTTDMFLNKTGTVMTRLEEEVFQALKKIHPKMADSKLKGALFMAVGAHRGIFMTEEEKAAYADPHMKPGGDATYASYYTNDTDPLTPLNPAHFFMRWQAEGSLPLWLFLPVEGFGNPLTGLPTSGIYDHRNFYDKMISYRDSFVKGRDSSIKGPLLIDFMLDIGNVGGPSKRRGWRIFYTTQGHHVYKPSESKSGLPSEDLDVLETWKAVENIGYEICYDFMTTGKATGLLKQKYESSSEKRKFINYLYENYFVSDSSKFNEADAKDFLNRLEPEAVKIANLKLKNGMIKQEDVAGEIESQKGNLFLAEALARLVAKRFPSKILRVDRDRFHQINEKDEKGNIIKSGESRWKKIRHKMGLSSSDFDKVMKNLGIAEMGLRKKVSAEMKTRIRKYVNDRDKNLEDLDVGFHISEVHDGLNFRLTDKWISNYMAELGDENHKFSEAEIKDVVKLWKFIQEDYGGGETQSSKKFLTEFAKFINPNISEEGGYTFTFGLDDTDMSLVAYRGTGGRLIARALKDTGAIEKSVTDEIMHFNDKLHAVAVDGKKDFMPIVESLKKIRETLSQVHGPDYGQKVAHHLALAVINFYKKDTLARSWATSWLVSAQPHSMVAELYAGNLSNESVWEWDVSTIDQFIFQLGRLRVLSHTPYDPSSKKGNPVENKDFKIYPFGIEINLGKAKSFRANDFEWWEGKLRRDAGALGSHKLWELANTVLPIFLMWLIGQLIAKGAKELSGGKQGSG